MRDARENTGFISERERREREREREREKEMGSKRSIAVLSLV
jgi:hypothetical protein